jgi:hypothetical protein
MKLVTADRKRGRADAEALAGAEARAEQVDELALAARGT